jgi:hypothetical protein
MFSTLLHSFIPLLYNKFSTLKTGHKNFSRETCRLSLPPSAKSVPSFIISLERFKLEGDSFLKSIVTGDETLLHTIHLNSRDGPEH